MLIFFAARSAFELIKAAMPERGYDINIAVVDIGASTTNVNVPQNNQSVYICEQPFGGAQLTQNIQNKFWLSAEEDESAKRAGGLPNNYESEVLQPFMDSRGLGIARATQCFFSSTQYKRLTICVCAAIPGMDEAVAKHTHV